MVRRGEALGQLECLALELEILELEDRRDALKMELSNLEQLSVHRSEAVLQVGAIRQSLDATEKMLSQKKQTQQDLALTAPRDGIVISPPWKPRQRPQGRVNLEMWHGSPLEKKNLDSTLEPGTIFCYVGDPKALDAVLIVDQSYREFLMPGQSLKLKLNEFPDLVFHGTVGEIEEQTLDSVPVQLSVRAGGDVPTSTQQDGTEKPDSAAFRVRFPLDDTALDDGTLENGDNTIKINMTGIAKISVANQTLGQRARRLFNQTFQFKL